MSPTEIEVEVVPSSTTAFSRIKEVRRDSSYETSDPALVEKY